MMMETLIGLVQGLVLLGQAILTGCCIISILQHREGSSRVEQSLKRLAVAAGVAAIPALGLLYVLRSRVMLDLPLSAICTADGLVMLGTRFGHAIETALVLTGAATIACGFGYQLPTILFGLGAVATAIAASHALTQAFDVAALAPTTVHILLATAWFGCLPALLLLSRLDRALFWKVLRRFSGFALPMMSVVLASGIWMASETVGSWPRLFATGYGAVLLTKFFCIGAALAAAFVLRWRLAAGPSGDTVEIHLLLSREVAGATLIMITAGILTQQTPAAHQAISWPYSFRIAPVIAVQTDPANLTTLVAAIAVDLVLCVSAAVLVRKGRVAFATMAGVLGLGVALVWGVPAISVPAYPTTYLPPDVPYDAGVVARGASIYAANCAVCHGAAGHADGPAASGMKPPPADLTKPHTTFHTMGDMYWWVTHGYPGAAMPGFAGSLSDDERWSVITYVMAVSLGYQARVLGPDIVPRQPWLHAIEFMVPAGATSVPFLATTAGRARLLTLVADCGTAADDLRRVWSGTDAWSGSDGLLVRAVIDPRDCSVPASSIRLASLKQPSDATAAIVSSWSLYRRSFSNADASDADAGPEALVFLVDRFSFVRARCEATKRHGRRSRPTLSRRHGCSRRSPRSTKKPYMSISHLRV
ncbi:c-type cytochrome [Bradyrhizobium sp. USDA 10063]